MPAERVQPRRVRPRSTPRTIAVVAAPALLAVVLGVQRSAVMPLWRDEFATRLYASLSPADLFRATAHVDAVLTPYYLLMHALSGATGLGMGMRIPSLVAFGVAVAGVALLALCWFGPGRPGTVGALVAGTAVATNGVLISQAANARPYALATMFVVLAVLGLELARRGRLIAGGVGFAACAAAAVALQPFAALMLVATVALAAGRGRRAVLLWLGVSVPWVVVAGAMLWSGRGQAGQLAWVAVPGFDAILRTLGALAGAPVAAPALVAAIVVAGVAALGLVALIALHCARAAVVFALLAAFLPTVALSVASVTVHPVLDVRYVTWSCTGTALLLGGAASAAVRAFPRRAHRRWPAIGGALVAVLVAVSSTVTAIAWVDPPARKDDFPATVARIDRDARLGDLVVVVQRYEQGGVAFGMALAAGDDVYAREIVRDVTRGARTVLDLRRVVGRDPLRTVPAAPGEAAGDGRTLWIVSIWPPQREDPAVLGPRLADCYRRAAAAPRIPVTGTRLSRAPCIAE